MRAHRLRGDRGIELPGRDALRQLGGHPGGDVHAQQRMVPAQREQRIGQRPRQRGLMAPMRSRPTRAFSSLSESGMWS